MSAKTKIILGGIGLFLLLGAIGSASSPKTSVESTQTSAPITKTLTPPNTPTLTPTDTPNPTFIPQNPSDNSQQYQQTQSNTPTTGNSQSGLNNNNYYTNSYGNQVHSPAYTTNGSVPAGATAQCNDGTYSFSQHHSGTCSGHGGVATWY